LSGHISEALILTNKDFNLEISLKEVSTAKDFEQVLAKLIQHLLDNDLERLINCLYRIDVSEEQVKLAMTGNNVAEQIALLIIEREMQKVITREKYKPMTKHLK